MTRATEHGKPSASIPTRASRSSWRHLRASRTTGFWCSMPCRESEVIENDAAAPYRKAPWLDCHRGVPFGGYSSPYIASRRRLIVGLDQRFAGEPGCVQGKTRCAHGERGRAEDEGAARHPQ